MESLLFFGGGSGAALSVADVTLHIDALLRGDDILCDVWVRGEIANCTRAASGHYYFTLKDEAASLGCVMFRSAAMFLPFKPTSGMQVLACGGITVYAPRGQYQLQVTEMQPDGLGALHLALEQTRARLVAEGLTDEARKRPLPQFPSRVAVVTSLSGAAVRDICVTLQRDPYPPVITLVPALVQGDGAVESLAKGVAQAGASGEADVIIVGRGGGSLEDLWAFNTEPVARAIAACPVPVIAAVGHETDFTLADMVADWRAPTPTAAAERIASDRAAFLRRLEAAEQMVAEHVRIRLREARMRLAMVAGRAPLAHPLWLIETRRQRLDDLEGRLARVGSQALDRGRHRLALAVERMRGVDPLATLARGYSAVTRPEDGTPIPTVQGVKVGEKLRVRMRDGSLLATVTEIEAPVAQTAKERSEP